MSESTAKKVFRWTDLPTVRLVDDHLARAGFRGDDCILTFNWIDPNMPRWEPHSHPFDQVVMTMSGRLMVELDGEAVECGAGSLVHIPANVKHTGWPVGDTPVLNCDLFAPPRADYLYLTEYQKEFPQAAKNNGRSAYQQIPTASPFSGKMMKDTKDILFKWDDLPAEQMFGGTLTRTGFRGDDCLITFNWIKPEMKRPEPHSHPFDQIIVGVEGRHVFEIDGVQTECEAGTIVRVPSNAMHTGWAVGDKTAFNIDIFAPVRADYLYLTDDQWKRSLRHWNTHTSRQAK